MSFRISISTKTRVIYALLLACLLSGVVVADAYITSSVDYESGLLLSDEENKSESEKFESKEGKNKESGIDGNDFERNCGYSHKKNDFSQKHSYYDSIINIYLSIIYKNANPEAFYPSFNPLSASGLRVLYHSLVFYDIFS